MAPRARPMPAPPHAAPRDSGAARVTRWSLTHTIPTRSSRRDALRLVAVGGPHRRAEAERDLVGARDRLVLGGGLATVSTGPGTSSRAIRMRRATPVRTTGATYGPSPVPPQCTRAPPSTASATSSRTRSARAGARAGRRPWWGRTGRRRRASSRPRQTAARKRSWTSRTTIARSMLPPHWPALANAAHARRGPRAFEVGIGAARASRPCRRSPAPRA